MSTNKVELRDSESGATGWELALRRAVRNLRYGSVEVLVHDGRVVQVETREKLRFADSRSPDDRKRPDNPKDRADRTPGGATTEETFE